MLVDDPPLSDKFHVLCIFLFRWASEIIYPTRFGAKSQYHQCRPNARGYLMLRCCSLRHRMLNRQQPCLARCRGETVQRSRSVVSCFARTREFRLTDAVALIRKNFRHSVIRLFYRDSLVHVTSVVATLGYIRNSRDDGLPQAGVLSRLAGTRHETTR